MSSIPGIFDHQFSDKFRSAGQEPFPFGRIDKRIGTAGVFLTAAHHGATLLIDAIDPVGTMDARVYKQLGEVFSELIPYEPYYKGEPIEDVGLYYSLKSKFNPNGEEYTNYIGVTQALETMIEKGLVSKKTTSVKILARGKLDKPLTVIADVYSIQAVKMILLTGGRVIKHSNSNE